MIKRDKILPPVRSRVVYSYLLVEKVSLSWDVGLVFFSLLELSDR